jgi:hypothetical protein
MAGNARFHDKLHRKNHHSLPTVGYPDSGTDPIASHDEPFQGDFVINGSLSTSAGLSFLSADISGDVYCENIYIADTVHANILSSSYTETIISDGALTGYGDHTLTLDYTKAIYANTPVFNILDTLSSNNTYSNHGFFKDITVLNGSNGFIMFGHDSTPNSVVIDVNGLTLNDGNIAVNDGNITVNGDVNSDNIASISTSIDNINSSINTLNTTIDTLSTNFNTLSTNTDTLSTKLDTVSGDVITINQGFSSLKDINGFTKLLNGVTMQWGSLSTDIGSVSSYNVNVAFPIPFDNACFNFVASIGIQSVNYDDDLQYRLDSQEVSYGVPSLTGVSGQAFLYSSYSTSRIIQWTAFGY